MANLREFWDEMKDGDEVKCKDGSIAFKRGIHLYWKGNNEYVSAGNILTGDWTLVKPKPAEIDTERWMRCDSSENKQFLYQDTSSLLMYTKSEIEDLKKFLYWGGEDLLSGREWPGSKQVIWANRKQEHWLGYYCKGSGHTEQLVAGWAVMRKEK